MIIDGKKLAEKILRNLARKRKQIKKPIRLVAVLVGDDPSSLHFLRQKEKACRKIDIAFSLRRYPAHISRFALRQNILRIVSDKKVSGLIIQLPLPKKIGEPDEFLRLLPKEKDPDVLGAEAFGVFAAGQSRILPPVVGAIEYLIKKYKIPVRARNVVIIGAGRLVGKPSAIWFMYQGATVSVLNEWTKNLSKFTKAADILVTGAGKPNLIRGSMVKKGVVVFDAGYSVRNNRPVGDFDFSSVSKKASIITPVPGGIGPLAVAMLLGNLIMLRSCNPKIHLPFRAKG